MGVILLFHDFAETSSDPLQFTYLQFQELVERLRENGFNITSLKNLIKNKTKNSIAITIDDGFVSSIKATDILSCYGIRPTIFINPMELGKSNKWRRNTNIISNIVTKKQLKKLAIKADIGHHGWYHQSLLSSNTINFIIQSFISHIWFKYNFGFFPEYFSYPFGDTNSKFAFVADVFFKASFLASPQNNCKLLAFPRLELYADEKTDIIIKKINLLI